MYTLAFGDTDPFTVSVEGSALLSAVRWTVAGALTIVVTFTNRMTFLSGHHCITLSSPMVHVVML